MGHLRVLLRKHTHHIGIVVLECFLDVGHDIVQDFEGIVELWSLGKLHPFWVVDEVVSLLGLALDSIHFGQAVLEEIECGQVGVVFLAQVNCYITDEVVRHDVAVVLTFGSPSPELTFGQMA